MLTWLTQRLQACAEFVSINNQVKRTKEHGSWRCLEAKEERRSNSMTRVSSLSGPVDSDSGACYRQAASARWWLLFTSRASIEVWHGQANREITRTLTFKLPIRLFRLNKRLGKKHYGNVVGEKMKTALKIPRTDQALYAH